MLSPWTEVESKIDGLLRRFAKLQSERGRLEAENTSLRGRIATLAKEREQLSSRLDRVLADLEALEAQIRG